MEDSDYVCPLCCEELDISDREFYPCKCGYQVCMWCWHRIRESESGLCPACRTPYGEDPHQFSAVDVEQVLLKAAASANKEKKEAAAKRERQRQLQESGGAAVGGELSTHLQNVEVPKDRSQLANMRVIRRNLVYAVGLPPNAAIDETLKKPEYFGQYGRIAKIVINRTQVTNPTVAVAAGAGGDARRASASAYVTFVHKEDTLACILALDGFYLDGRNIRASYGTSKYCSAFIKNVRCNNPECTYLHEMGASEDTFTKQEIQAGYVTSGRDVLARQQQIVAEQMRLGQTGAMPRKKVGGGGPSGTGKAATTPIFPPPEYDEPSKPSPPLVPPPAGITRSVTSATVAAGLSLNPANIAAKLGRSNSTGVVPAPGGRSPPSGSIPGSAPPPSLLRKSQSSGTNTAMTTGVPVVAASVASSTASVGSASTTAASVVASGRSLLKSSSESSSNDHANTTLTPLTPLKRTAKAASTRAPVSVGGGPQQPLMSDGGTTASNTGEKLTPLRNGSIKKQSNGGAPSLPAITNPQHPHAGASSVSSSSGVSPLMMIGGDVIGPPNLKPRASANVLSAFVSGDTFGGGLSSSSSSSPMMMDALGGLPIGGLGSCISSSGSVGVDSSSSSSLLAHRSSALGGEVFTGQLPSRSAIGSNSHNKWNNSPVAGPIGGSVGGGIGHVGGVNSGPLLGRPSGPGLFNDSYPPHGGGDVDVNLMSNRAPCPVGGSVIGHPRQNVDTRFSSSNANSSSALASILGINLPTGSGSLQESSVLWTSSSMSSSSSHPTPSPSPLAALNSSAIPSQDFFSGGGRPAANNSSGGSSLIGGIPIGGAPGVGVGSSSQGAIGGGLSGVIANSMSDIALLQSLLPGVHITSGTDSMGFGVGGIGCTIGGGSRGGVGGGWPGSAVVGPPGGPSSLVGLGSSGLQGDAMSGNVGWNTTSGGGGMTHHDSTAGSSIGAIGQNVNVGGSQGHHHRGPGIW